MNKSEVINQLRLNIELTTPKLVKLRQLEEELHKNIDHSIALNVAALRWLQTLEKEKE